MRKTYHGIREEGRGCKVYVMDGEEKRDLNPRHDLYNHSPDGFEFGYGGSGPAQLALAICADVLGDDRQALEVYQAFKSAVIATIPTSSWMLTEDFVRGVIHGLKART